jgi:8-oxo-dGTP pyrophosphatase MutT (NUDIX family)
MERGTRLPDHLVADAMAFESGERSPVEPKHASTVVLLREGSGGPGSLEVYLLRRHVEMAFAAGMCVFPGGGVDPRDFDQLIGWTGPAPVEWAALMSVDEPLARALVCAAVRETFEESGVLLAGSSPDDVVADTTAEDWEADRAALESRELSFTDFLSRRGLVLRTDLLRLWGSWVTPAFEPRRFDTRFFVARLPAGQVTRDVSGESDRVFWSTIRDAIRAVDAGDMLMMPPTYCTCAELHEYADSATALDAAADRDLTPVRPAAVRHGDEVQLSIPEGLVELGREIAERARA